MHYNKLSFNIRYYVLNFVVEIAPPGMKDTDTDERDGQTVIYGGRFAPKNPVTAHRTVTVM